jgi:hypothetical protein
MDGTRDESVTQLLAAFVVSRLRCGPLKNYGNVDISWTKEHGNLSERRYHLLLSASFGSGAFPRFLGFEKSQSVFFSLAFSGLAYVVASRSCAVLFRVLCRSFSCLFV